MDGLLAPSTTRPSATADNLLEGRRIAVGRREVTKHLQPPVASTAVECRQSALFRLALWRWTATPHRRGGRLPHLRECLENAVSHETHWRAGQGCADGYSHRGAADPYYQPYAVAHCAVCIATSGDGACQRHIRYHEAANHHVRNGPGRRPVWRRRLRRELVGPAAIRGDHRQCLRARQCHRDQRAGRRLYRNRSCARQSAG